MGALAHVHRRVPPGPVQALRLCRTSLADAFAGRLCRTSLSLTRPRSFWMKPSASTGSVDPSCEAFRDCTPIFRDERQEAPIAVYALGSTDLLGGTTLAKGRTGTAPGGHPPPNRSACAALFSRESESRPARSSPPVRGLFLSIARPRALDWRSDGTTSDKKSASRQPAGGGTARSTRRQPPHCARRASLTQRPFRMLRKKSPSRRCRSEISVSFSKAFSRCVEGVSAGRDLTETLRRCGSPARTALKARAC